jgi:hypothetical protein
MRIDLLQEGLMGEVEEWVRSRLWLLRHRGRLMKQSLVGVGMVVVMSLQRRGVVRDKGCQVDLVLGGEALDFQVDREV